jgi:uncharacterized membrane protein
VTGIRPTLFACAAAIAGSLLGLSGASAGPGDITFCNQFPHTVNIAIAYVQTDVETWLARGWLEVETGKCYVFDTAIRVATFYYHAESEPYREGRRRVKTSWGTGKDFSVRDSHFQTYQAEKKLSGLRYVGFTKGPEMTGGAITATVTFLAEGGSMVIVPPPGGAGSEQVQPIPGLGQLPDRPPLGAESPPAGAEAPKEAFPDGAAPGDAVAPQHEGSPN